MNRWLAAAWVGALGCAWLGSSAWAAEAFGLESVGVRAGFTVNSSASAGFKEAEGFTNFKLPWRWELGRDWHMEPRLDLSLGWVGDARSDALLATVGPTFVLGWRRFPVTLEAGVSPSYLSQPHFATKNVGCSFQLTSHGGVNWDFAPHWRLSYRFQHMSNAGLSADNPGLNMHLFGLSYVF